MTPAGQQLFTSDEWSDITQHIRMSPRQAEIAAHLLQGSGDKKIAKELGIAVATVRTHLSRLFARLEVQDRHELVLHLFRQFRIECKQKGCPRNSGRPN